MLPSRAWCELTTADLEAADMASVIAVLPVAAVEQHGPHLPLGTDLFIMQGYLDAVAAQLPDDLPVVMLPIQAIGYSLEHADYSGTLSLSCRNALDAWKGLIEQVAKTGCRKFVIVNSHGGNSPVLDILARELRAALRLLVVLASWQRFGYPDGLFTEDERRLGIHGGAIETSLMLAFRPDLVRHAKAVSFVSVGASLERDNAWLRVSGRPTGFGWMAQDLNEAGVVGDATTARAESGRACAHHGARAFVDLICDVARFDPAALRSRRTPNLRL